MNYSDFLRSKIVAPKDNGIEVSIDEIHPMLFDWQRQVVRWALRRGKAALFEDTGLGKTLQQIEWARHIADFGRKVLIVCPLAVAHQTVNEGRKIGVEIEYVRSQDAAEKSRCLIVITNYDMLKAFDGERFAGVILDESSILKHYTGKTKQLIIEMFADTPFKLCCTATPAPNDHLELGNHAQFLDVMDSNEMISRWFINDPMQAGAYRLKGHARASFWNWVSSWAVCMSHPSDLGYSNNGFVLPPLEIKYERVYVPESRGKEVGKLFFDESLSATGMWREKAATAADRCARVSELVNASSESWIVWCETNQEADLLKKQIPGSLEVRGSESIASKERAAAWFLQPGRRVLISKPEIFGWGCNFQHCRNMAFVGLSYSFEKFYQAVRRCWRYGQKQSVNAHVVFAETEGDIVKVIEEKQGKHSEMQSEMNAAMRGAGWGEASGSPGLRQPQSDLMEGEGWTLILGDAVTEIERFEDNLFHFSIYSPPFSNLYIYSDSVADMGNSASDNEFLRHYKFLVEKLYAKTLPGRLAAVHCKDLPLYINRDGAAGLRDFPGMIIRLHEECGWVYQSRVTIWKDPVIEMQRTKNHGLLYKNLRLRGEVTRQGMADYLVVFRKWDGVERSESPEPVTHERDEFPLEQWQKWASPVWMDIDQTDVLNCQMAREGKDERHICPLQLGVIERCVKLWSNPGELVFSPFAGIGSEGYMALKLGRRFAGIELKESYWKVACENLRLAAKTDQPSLFPEMRQMR